MLDNRIFSSLIALFLGTSVHNNLFYQHVLFSSHFLLSQKAIPFKPSEQLEEQLIEGMDQGMKGNYPGAIQIFSRLIKAYPNYADAYYNRGLARKKLGDKQDAIADYDQAIKINPNLAEAYQERGNLWLELENKNQAIQDFQKAAQLYQKQENSISYDQVMSKIHSLQKP